IKTLDVLSYKRNGVVVAKESKTRSSRRTVLVSEGTARAINDHIAAMPVALSRLLFPTAAGNYYWPHNVGNYWFRKILKDGGLDDRDLRFHDLRHTCATLLLLNGVDVKTVAARLGHSSPTITLQTYAHLLPEGEQKATKAIEGFLRPDAN